MNRNLRIILFLTLMGIGCAVVAADGDAPDEDLERYILGEWKMETRILRSTGLVTYQQTPSIFVTEQLPDGTFRVITTYTARAVADTDERHRRPECEGKKDCSFDSGSEGIGRIVNNKFYIDWIDEGWIDDVLTISGNTMTGDDGNGPIRLTKVE